VNDALRAASLREVVVLINPQYAIQLPLASPSAAKCRIVFFSRHNHNVSSLRVFLSQLYRWSRDREMLLSSALRLQQMHDGVAVCRTRWL